MIRKVWLWPVLLAGFLWLCSFGEGGEKEEAKKVFTVVLDAGHGGRDPGKVANGVKEKDIALDIVLLIGKELEKHDDIKVVYTRKTDKFINLYVRGKIANEANADLFVSVHCNAHNSNAHGSETYVLGLHANRQNFEVAKTENEVIYLEEDHETNYAGYNINSPESIIGLTIMQEEFLTQSIQLAKLLQDNFTVKLKRKNRGVKQAGFIVLHQTFMPSVLIETGFITNRNEKNYLASKKGKSEVAENIAEAVIHYKKNITDNIAVDDIPVTPEKENVSPGVVFKVQIAAGHTKIEPKRYNFRGLEPISMETFGSAYRYMYGETPSYDDARELQRQAKDKGYDSAYIVAYKNGERIAVDKVLQN
ncbi:N-acetylmuramoyl-L-alanine amidase family protein [Sinomicrobium weinanense]|uniref:N-acetylmuramoyl-L-alanine amidase n=1 Tax=Sinomicrobium weinanense TaxID=2842200 RepID=A0A926JQH7_9FLAO|nr:N-acetylmuramoyl-L-alanine amidase [Sinomicrobium weinanense]MBC9795514.1 N-acetylmuramoyl-L-alanine amidase [Sinomicrobium weinanense]MBU3123339.1 N-acetylmuramoyl-L-alanine amidase [Sinomicrobium weinanense]